jgi:Fe-S-cluster containining protein
MCGICCRIFFINLTESEYKSGLYQTMFQDHGFVNDFENATEIGAHFLAQNQDGSCLYLKDNQCSIHTKRPEVCRPFCCDSENPQFKDMIKKIEQFRSK